MSITVRWDDNHEHIITIECVGNWLSDDYTQAIEATQRTIGDVTHYDAIVMMISLTSVDPVPILILTFIRQLIDHLKTRPHTIIVITHDPLLTVLAHLIRPFYAQRHIHFDTATSRQDAIDQIMQRRVE